MKCKYEIQTYPFEDADEKGHNILVKLGDSENKIIVGAHYDVAERSGGANDNGSGISILLKFIQNFIKEGTKLSHSVEVIFFDHEETPESGARYYARTLPEEIVKGMFNLDICGMGDTIVFNDKGKLDDSIIQAVIQAIEFHQYNYTILHELPASDERQFEEVDISNIQLSVSPKGDVEVITKLVSAQNDLRDALNNGDITPREADEIIKQRLGVSSLPKLLRVMHTPDDLSIHLSEKTLMMVLNVITKAVSLYDKL